jgi:hypothetical protein
VRPDTSKQAALLAASSVSSCRVIRTRKVFETRPLAPANTKAPFTNRCIPRNAGLTFCRACSACRRVSRPDCCPASCPCPGRRWHLSRRRWTCRFRSGSVSSNSPWSAIPGVTELAAGSPVVEPRPLGITPWCICEGPESVSAAAHEIHEIAVRIMAVPLRLTLNIR